MYVQSVYVEWMLNEWGKSKMNLFFIANAKHKAQSNTNVY